MQFKEFRGNIPVAVNVPYIPAASGAAGGGSFVVPNNMLITAANVLWGASITGTATNFFTISFFNRTSGAGTVQWGTAIAYSNAVNATKATPVAVTLSSTASDLQLAAGDCVSVEITTTGTGLICPGGTVMLTLRNR